MFVRLILGVLAGLFTALSVSGVPFQSCTIPWWITIQGAEDPCWTIGRLQSQYREAEEDVYFSRWLTDKSFSRINLESGFIQLIVIEHPDVFMVGDTQALGVLRTGGLGLIDTIEYSIKHEKEGPVQVLRHEWGHLRELREEVKWDALNAFTKYGWWHFGHGDFLDPLVESTNLVKDWFFRGLPERHPYYPGKIGHESAKGTPGTFSWLSQEQTKLFSDFKYHMEHHPEHKIAACILHPQ